MSRLLRLITVVALTGGGLLVAPVPEAVATDVPPGEPTTPGPTIVSITFDDGLANQMTAAAILDNAGMDGTFYVNSGRVGISSTYMTRSDLDTLAAAGHEIAGHSVSHLNLTGLTVEGQRRQICNDRNTLMGWGFPIKSFAYPFTAYNSDTISVVQECGYNSARRVSDLASQNACDGCPTAETIPPRNVWAIRTPDSIKVDTTLDSLKRYVTQAEDNGGGWVPLVFHHICNACDPNSITAADFQAFVTWLAARGTGTEVKTVDAVIGGQLNPPPPITPPGPGTGELQNPGLELDTNNDDQADCWQRAGFGTNTARFSRTSDARTGSFAERVDITSYTTGARRLIVRQDDGTCSPAILPGDEATLSVWYKSNASVRFSVFYRDSADTWRSWKSSASYPASSTWTQATYTTPQLPADAIGISWGLNLQAVGYLVTDDYSMQVPLRDTVAPVVGLLAPTEGVTVSGPAVGLSATAEDEVGVRRVDFLVNGAVVGTDASAPYGFAWDSTTVANGTATVEARAVDTSDNVGLSGPLSVTIDNATPGLGAINGGLEDDVDGDGMPDCWQAAGSGANTFTFSRTTDARSGSFAERLDVLTWTDGVRRLIVKQDAGQCAIPVEPDRSYTLAAWVKSTAPSRLTAFYRDAAGSWVTWANGPLAAASETWSQLAWTTPPVPGGATHLSFGVSLATVGSITVDDHAISLDLVPPTVTVTTPAQGALVGGPVLVTASASDDVGVGRVDFLADGAVVASDTTRPYSATWDSTTSADGPVTLTARATDTSSNVGTSDGVTVTVANADQGWGVQNASLEMDSNSNGVPDCWQTSGSGTNSFTYARVNDARTGSFAERIDITAWTSGGRRLIQTLEATPADCAIPVLAGDTYTLSGWVKGTGTIRMTAFYRVDGAWKTTTVNSPTSAAAAGWTRLSWTPAAVPTGATHISFGVTLVSVGSIVVDDLAINATLSLDSSPPTVSVTEPADQATVSGAAVTLSASAGDDRGISSVEFLVDEAVVGTDTTAPYAVAWDSTTAPDGPVSIRARATDTSANATTSAARTITVDNSVTDATAPSVSLSAPVDGATVTGTSVAISADATDDVAVASVAFFVGGTRVGTDTTAPYSVSWDSTSVPAGTVELTAVATDTSGNGATSASRSVTVDNTGPSVAVTAPTAGATVSDWVTVSASASDTAGVGSVEFYAGATSIGTDTAAPFETTWNTTTSADGTVPITAVASDALGNQATSAPRSVTIDNTDPTVSVSQPADGATVSGNVSIVGAVTDSSAVSVEFLVDGIVVNRDSTGPSYNTSWDSTTVTDGPVTITARATDAAGNVSTSAAVSVNVLNADFTPPVVSVTAPVEGATVAGSSVTLSATATDNVAVASVQFFVEGVSAGTDTTAPYSVSWDSTSVASGTVSITATATDTSANVGTSTARTVTVDNNPPVVALTAPADGAIVGGRSVTVTATATDALGISRVEFFVGTTLIARDTSAPYSVRWNSTKVSNGAYSLTARATDTTGQVATSPARTVTVQNPS